MELFARLATLLITTSKCGMDDIAKEPISGPDLGFAEGRG